MDGVVLAIDVSGHDLLESAVVVKIIVKYLKFF